MIPAYTITVEDDEGYECDYELPARYEVCDRCEGTGKHDHPAFDNGITASEWAEWDQDEREDYLRGAYDVVCTVCKGRRVVLTVDEERLSDEQRKVWEKHREDQYQAAQERAAERRYQRMESGYYRGY